MERRVLIDKYCGWPLLVRTTDGNLLMTVYNKPHHGGMDGELECWRSEDDGLSFQYSANPFPHIPNLKDASVGVAHNGDVVIMVMGTANGQRGPMLSRSSDNGKSFHVTRTEIMTDVIPGDSTIVPYGNIVRLPDSNTLAVAVYTVLQKERSSHVYICLSDDDGLTWDRYYRIGDDSIVTGMNETELFFFNKNHGIAVCRTSAHELFRAQDENGNPLPIPPCEKYTYNECLLQYRTQDGGRTWSFEGALTGTGSHPANLCMLESGELLLSYGCRYKPMSLICAQLSSSEGRDWGDVNVLATYEACDGGYPSSMQNPDGSVCTVYYVQEAAYHTGYHVAGVVWKPEDMIRDAWIGGPCFVRKNGSLYDSKPEDALRTDWQYIL